MSAKKGTIFSKFRKNQSKIPVKPMQEQTKSSEDRHTQLIQAAKNGDNDELQSLCTSATVINLKDKEGHRAVDYAWESQHYKVVLSLLEKDSVFPHRFDLELENDTDEWKDLKTFVEERNRLHNFVKGGKIDEVRKNYPPPIKSKYFLNSENQSLLHTAIKNKNFEISDFLASNGVDFFHKNEKCAADEVINKTVNDNLNEFVKYFVEEFEAKLHCYRLILEGKIKKPGKYSEASGKIGSAVVACIPVDSVKLGAKGVQAICEYVGNAIGSEHHRKKVITLNGLIEDFQNDKANFRRKLVEDGVNIFQSYEVQFMRVTTDQGPKQAMQLLARDATNRIISCYEKGNDNENIIEGVVSGISKIESVLGMPIPTSKIKNPGFKIYYGSCKWSTASLFQKVGLVNEETYYENKDGKSKVDKYGCRRLLKSEDWDKIKDSWNKLDPSNDTCRFKNCKYVLNLPDSKIQTKMTNILENINGNDEKLMEARIKEMLNEIIELVHFSQKENEEVHEILATLKNDLKNLKVDEYFEKVKTEHKEIKKLLKAGQEDNKKDHQITHEMIQSLNLATKESISFDVREPTDYFSGREKELIDLHNELHRKPENPTAISQMTLISGLGGIGKTELAAQFIKEHAEDFENVIWINAENEEALQESFTRLAKDTLKIQTKDENGTEKHIKSVVKDVYAFFRRRKTLFIFDNAEINGFKNFLPLKLLPENSIKPYILITSRNREREEAIQVIHLKELTLQDAIDLIKKKLNIQDECLNQEIKALAEKLQCFPLAIHQAIAYIADKKVKKVTEKYSISDYLKEYEKEPQDLLDNELFKTMVKNYERTTFTTWKITIDRIVNDKEHGKLSSDILNTIAYLAPEHINIDTFIVKARGSVKNVKLAVSLLVKYSMVNSDEEQNVLSIHKLVQEVIRLELRRKNKEEKVLKDVFELLKIKFHSEYEKSDYAKKRQTLIHLEAFTSHIDEWMEKKPQNKKNIEQDFLEYLLDWMSIYYIQLGDPKKVLALLERQLAIQEEHYGKEDVRLVPTIENLSNAYGDLGNPEKKKELLERALAIEEKHYGSEHLEVAATLVNLGNACGDLGDLQKKKELLEKALAIKEKYYGSEHFELANTLVNLGNAYDDLGDHQKKKELLERALAMQEKHYGSEHFQVALTLANLGNVYGNLGDHQKKKEFLERALAIQEKHYGSEHFQMVNILRDLGKEYLTLRDPQKGKEFLERALAIQEKYVGSEHFELIVTLDNLGHAYGELGDYQKKKELLERALALQEKYYGSEHFELAAILVNLSTAYYRLGNPQKQKELLERALAIQEKHYGSEHLEMAVTLEHLGCAYGALGDLQKQMKFTERALAIQEKYYGSGHFEVAGTLVKLGNAYGDLGDRRKQKKLLERALAIQEKHYGSEHLELAATLVNLSTAYYRLGNPQKQKELLERALAIQEKHYGSEHFELADTLKNLGCAYGDLGHHQKEKELLERALAMQEEHYGSEHFKLAPTLVNLSCAYGAFGAFQNKKELLERALAIQEKHYGSEYFKLAPTLVNLGNAYRALRDPQKGKEFLERALAIQEKYVGSEHFELIVTLHNLGHAYGELGDHQKKKDFLERASAIRSKH